MVLTRQPREAGWLGGGHIIWMLSGGSGEPKAKGSLLERSYASD